MYQGKFQPTLNLFLRRNRISSETGNPRRGQGTHWVNSYVIVEKDTGSHHSPNHTIKKKLRICLDPRDLNEALEREPYHTHSVDEITAKLQGMTVFTIVDFKKGYWMVVLHPDSRKLTCMALPFGRFQWT